MWDHVVYVRTPAGPYNCWDVPSGDAKKTT